jgi:hypothetical protein
MVLAGGYSSSNPILTTRRPTLMVAIILVNLGRWYTKSDRENAEKLVRMSDYVKRYFCRAGTEGT